MTSVLAAARLPVCSAGGALSGMHPVGMAAKVLSELTEQIGGSRERVDEVWLGCAEPVGAQGADMARAVILSAGLPLAVGGFVVDAAECSGTTALHAAVAAIEAGQIEFAAVIGVSCASLVPPGAAALGRTYGRPWADGPAARFESVGGLVDPHRGAELLAADLDIGRTQQERATARSITRRQDGRGSHGDELRILPDDLSSIPPAFEPDGTMTAATYAPPADGCCGLLLGPGELSAMGRIRSTGRSGGDPRSPAGGAAGAVAIALERAGLQHNDIVRWEIVESSAAALLGICRVLEIDADSVNPSGGALATGDSGGAEELRLLVDSVRTATADGPILTLVSGPTGAAATVLEVTPNGADPSAGS